MTGRAGRGQQSGALAAPLFIVCQWNPHWKASPAAWGDSDRKCANRLQAEEKAVSGKAAALLTRAAQQGVQPTPASVAYGEGHTELRGSTWRRLRGRG